MRLIFIGDRLNRIHHGLTNFNKKDKKLNKNNYYLFGIGIKLRYREVTIPKKNFWNTPKAEMNKNILVPNHSPSILIARDYQEQLELNSEILAASEQVYVPVINVTAILAWVQQHQPDLIVLDIKSSEIVKSGLITALRLDWLTRGISILVISDLSPTNAMSQSDLDCDAYLTRSSSSVKLEETICSLVPSPLCQPVVSVV